MVGGIGLAPDDDDRAVGTLLPQGLGAACARDAAAHDQEIDLAGGQRSASLSPAAARPSTPRRSDRRDHAARSTGEVKHGVTRGSSPGSRTTRTSSPASITESPVGTKPVPSRRIEITSEPSGSPSCLT